MAQAGAGTPAAQLTFTGNAGVGVGKGVGVGEGVGVAVGKGVRVGVGVGPGVESGVQDTSRASSTNNPHRCRVRESVLMCITPAKQSDGFSLG